LPTQATRNIKYMVNQEDCRNYFWRTFLSFLFVTLSLAARGQEAETLKISILFTGDIMGHDEQIWSAENRETHTYNYDEVFTYIKPVISEADIAIANFEVTLAGLPYKGYPQFSSPPALAQACKNAGIDYFVTANNHSADRGREGIEGTINRLDSLGIPHTGTFLSQAARDSLQPLIIRKKGASIALLNYTYGTNGIKIPYPVIVNQLDKEGIASDIEKAKSRNPDFIVLFLHWGTEYDTVPSKSQYDMSRYFLSKGADLIIGSHPHVLQKMVWLKNDTLLKDKAVVFSLGNFVSNQRKSKTDGGAMVRVELIRSGRSLKISNIGYYLTWVYTPIVNYRKKFYILPCSEFEYKAGFFDTPANYLLMKNFINDSRTLLYGQNNYVDEIIFKGNGWMLNK
jgi:poly-gamma-glutamate capsule biosynthesis protein CapA/YwtB (metallophosphatase superfamily)